MKPCGKPLYLGLGQSTCVGIGGDPLNGTILSMCSSSLKKIPQTEAILMIGEIGGEAEEEAAEWIKKHGTKPVAAFIAGTQLLLEGEWAMPERSSLAEKELHRGKIKALKKAGALLLKLPQEWGKLCKRV